MDKFLGDQAAGRFAPRPEAAARIRAQRPTLAADGLRAAIERDPGLPVRYDDTQLRLVLRDADRHLLQLASALELGDVDPMTSYVSMLVPLFRRRKMPLDDVATLLLGIRDAVVAALPPADGEAATTVTEIALSTLERPRHLPGDRRRNPIVSFLWKGAGFLD